MSVLQHPCLHLTLVGLLTSGCYTGVEFESSSSEGIDENGSESRAEQAFPGVDGVPATIYLSTPDGPMPFSYMHLDNGYGVLGGDVVLYGPEAGLPMPTILELSFHNHLVTSLGPMFTPGPQEGAVTVQIGGRWHNRTILWQTSVNVENKDLRVRIAQAVEDMDAAIDPQITNFVDWDNNIHGPDADRILVMQAEEGCKSDWVGRKGGVQRIQVSTDCSKGSIIHEFAHAIGLFHEQSRSDRDMYISVNSNNIRADRLDQYEKLGDIKIENLGAYRTDSIMHYDSCDFSKCFGSKCPQTCDFYSQDDPKCDECECEDKSGNCHPTMLDLNGKRITSQRTALTAVDIDSIEYALGCPRGADDDYCGGPIGLDADSLYTCNNGYYSKKEDCGSGTCIVAAEGTPDYCSAVSTCPSGTGWYCGDAVDLPLEDHLYYCKGGVFYTSMPEPFDCGEKGCGSSPAQKNDFCHDGSAPAPLDPDLPNCSDGYCDPGEDCVNCPQDCQPCEAQCGDGVCDASENCESCASDCGECPPGCPDGLCGNDESCAICPQDCGECVSVCSNGVCEADETCNSCPQDCGNCNCIENEVEQQACDPGTYCPPGAQERICTNDSWSAWGSCESNIGLRFHGDGGEHCGPVVCLQISGSGDDSSLNATISKTDNGLFSNNVDLTIFQPFSNISIQYGCLATQGLSSYNFQIWPDDFEIALGGDLWVNAQAFSPCVNGANYISGDAAISQCSTN